MSEGQEYVPEGAAEWQSPGNPRVIETSQEKFERMRDEAANIVKQASVDEVSLDQLPQSTGETQFMPPGDPAVETYQKKVLDASLKDSGFRQFAPDGKNGATADVPPDQESI